jgi:hypothetical protein
VLMPDPGKQAAAGWRASLLNSSDWKPGSMRLFNASAEPLGISAGTRNLLLKEGKSLDFHAEEWKGEAFPVKIHRLQPELKTIFSSSWRVTAGRRELCFITTAGVTLSVRSLLDLDAPPAPPAPPPP